MVGGRVSGLQKFSRDRLFLSIYESCKHRPQAIEDAAALTQTIISQLGDRTAGVFRKDEVAAICLRVLRRFDGVAATIYEAYHPAAPKD